MSIVSVDDVVLSSYHGNTKCKKLLRDRVAIGHNVRNVWLNFFAIIFSHQATYHLHVSSWLIPPDKVITDRLWLSKVKRLKFKGLQQRKLAEKWCGPHCPLDPTTSNPAYLNILWVGCEYKYFPEEVNYKHRASCREVPAEDNQEMIPYFISYFCYPLCLCCSWSSGDQDKALEELNLTLEALS